MSREQKLALILGFLAVLVVAMLISDHYSKANNDRLAADVADAPPMIDPATPSPYAGPLASNTPSASFAPLPPTHVDANADTAGNGFLGSALNAAGQDAASQNSVPAGQTPDGIPEPIRITQGRGDVSGVVDRIAGSIGSLPAAVSHTTIPTDPARDPSSDGINEEELRRQLELAAKAGESTPTTPTPAAERWHTVVNNDSLFAISKKYYGDGKHWKKLAEANKGRMGDNNTLRPGVRLLIPDAAALGIVAPKSDSAKTETTKTETAKTEPKSKPDAKADTKPATDKPEAKPGSGRTYEVKKGDTLGEIAMRELGTSKRAGEILKLNGLKDANSIRIGQKLKLPAK